MSSTVIPPALPPRRQGESSEVQGEADPPVRSSHLNAFGLADVPLLQQPAYEASPVSQAEQTLALGPSRPFQPSPTSQQYPSPASPPPPEQSNLPPPAFPFWNGASLTPQQTGFRESQLQPHPPPNGIQAQQTGGYGAPMQPPFAPQSTGNSWTGPQQPQWQSPHHTGSSSSYHPPPSSPPPLPSRPSAPPSYAPTTTPTPGQPLLKDGKLLVYPVGFECPKCSNTGFKPFGAGSGRAGDDPGHPCRGVRLSSLSCSLRFRALADTERFAGLEETLPPLHLGARTLRSLKRPSSSELPTPSSSLRSATPTTTTAALSAWLSG